MVIKRSPGGEFAGGGRSTWKSTCEVPGWLHLVIDQHPVCPNLAPAWTVTSEFDCINWPLTSDVYFLDMHTCLAMVVSESSFGVYVCLIYRRPAGLHRNQRSCRRHVQRRVTKTYEKRRQRWIKGAWKLGWKAIILTRQKGWKFRFIVQVHWQYDKEKHQYEKKGTVRKITKFAFLHMKFLRMHSTSRPSPTDKWKNGDLSKKKPYKEMKQWKW